MQEKPISRFYHGCSMLGTFRPGDQLIIMPAIWEKIQPGDVVLFRKNDRLEIVHRVMVVEGRGLVTRGDNNDSPDLELVSCQNLIGVVTNIERDGKLNPLIGGRLGLFWVNFLRFWIWFKRQVIFIGRYPYRWLRENHWLINLWSPTLTKIQLETEHGPVIKYICSRRTVARWWPARHYFECRKPYDLVIPDPEKNKQT